LTVVFFSSLAVSAALIYFLSRARIGKILLDVPSARGLHTVPVPKIGGIAIFATVMALAVVWMQRDLVAGIVALSLLLLVISLLDDIRPISALLRLLVHAAAAILVVLLWTKTFGLLPGSPGSMVGWMMTSTGAAMVMLAIVWVTNLYNFMDGADGLAGGMSLIGFGTFALALATGPDAGGSLGLLFAAISGATGGFLLFNFPPAKVFMGDAGAIPLGFLAVTLGIHGNLIGLWPWWFPMLVFSPFIVDATATLLRRTAMGHKPWIAHRDNYYQRLILSGWGHRKTALVYYAFMVTTAGSALCAMRSADSSAILLLWVITYLLLLILLEWRLHEKEKQRLKE
jgi:UDP-GlcNAc:undecaprenyl-phosphate/decaprenyl-phosphate GlcNAc-1-phosphate transferase